MTAGPPSLTAEERGFLAGLRCLGAEKAAVDRTLEGADRLRLAWDQLDARSQDQRVTALADWLSDARAPLPPGIADLEPSWVLEALAGEPHGLALALVEGMPELMAAVGAGEPWALEAGPRRELQRLVFGTLEPLAAEVAGPLGAELAALSREELLAEVARRGARTIGVSLAGTPLELRARAMATAGAPWSSDIAAAAARPTDPQSRDRARSLVGRAAGQPAPTPLHRLRAVGIAVLAAGLAAEGAGSVLRVAGRLPAEIGRELLRAVKG